MLFAVLLNQSLGPSNWISAAANHSHTIQTLQSTSQSFLMKCPVVFHLTLNSTHKLYVRPGGHRHLPAAGTAALPLMEATTWLETLHQLVLIQEPPLKLLTPRSRGEVRRLILAHSDKVFYSFCTVLFTYFK